MKDKICSDNVITKNEWYDLLDNLSDANIYQTWAYGKVKWGDNNLRHFVVKTENESYAMAQIRIVKYPFINTGFAYIFHGPLWKPLNKVQYTDVFEKILFELKKEYVEKRKLILRIVFHETKEQSQELLKIINLFGFKKNNILSAYNTLLIDLKKDLDELRGNLRRKWRYNLKQSEKITLNLQEDNSIEFFDQALDLYNQMFEIKKFDETVDIKRFKQLQKILPDKYKPKILLCKYKNQNVSMCIWSELGNTGILLFAATNAIGREINASYFTLWNMLVRLKSVGMESLDLGGIDPSSNPGGFTFKSGLVGNSESIVNFIGVFDCYNNYFIYRLAILGEMILNTISKSYKYVSLRVKGSII